MILHLTIKTKFDLTYQLPMIAEWMTNKFLQKRMRSTRSASQVVVKLLVKSALVIKNITICSSWKPRQKLLSNTWNIFNNKTKDCKLNGMDSAKESRKNWRNLMASQFWIITSFGSATETWSSNKKRISWPTNSKITNNCPSWQSKEWELSWRSYTS